MIYLLLLLSLSACGPIYVVDGGQAPALPVHHQPDYSMDAVRQGQRHNEMIMYCSGRAADFVTGRCM